MMFWFKRKKLVLDAFTNLPAVHEFFPITSMKESYPDWWKKLPALITTPNHVGLEFPGATIKKCDGVLALYARGFNIPLWSDIIIETETDGSFKYQTAMTWKNNPITEHHRDQIGPEFDNLIHMKIYNAWLFNEKTGVEFYFAPSWWNQIQLLPNMFVPPAIVNYKYQAGAEINLFLPKIQNRLELLAGQPMVQLIPLTEHNIEVKCHLITTEELRKKSGIDSVHAVTSFHNHYKLKKLAMQAKEKAKCPFGFGRK
jgi:hypothetical protein